MEVSMSSWGFLDSRTTVLGSKSPADLAEAFQRFLSSLELTDRQGELVADRHNSLRDRILLRAPFKIEKTILFGSYDRWSQIRPRPTDAWTLDVDVPGGHLKFPHSWPGQIPPPSGGETDS